MDFFEELSDAIEDGCRMNGYTSNNYDVETTADSLRLLFAMFLFFGCSFSRAAQMFFIGGGW